jgi:DNA-binding protein HU-beta
VNKSGLIDAVSKTTSLAKRDAEDAVNALLHIVSSEVRSGRRVVVAGFGSFNPTHRGPRLGRNPQTGAPVRVGATRGVRFAASGTFKEVLNGKAALGTPKLARRPAAGVVGKASGKSAATKTGSSTRTPVRRVAGGLSKASAKKAVPVTAGRTTKKVVGRAPARKAATRAPARKAARQSARKAAGRPPAKRASQRSAKKAVRRA